MTDRSTVHDTFVLERTYPAAPARVWAAFADKDQKATWFGAESDTYSTTRWDLDFTVGGREHNEGAFADGTTTSFDAIYLDIVDNERLIYSYFMLMNGQKISVSVATIELTPADNGTHLRLTELGVYLDGFDNADQRREGTDGLLDALGRSL